jgi:hypothetical protein
MGMLALVADTVRRERRYLNSGVVLDDMKRRGEQKFLERPKAEALAALKV